jgi:hypothetical protein
MTDRFVLAYGSFSAALARFAEAMATPRNTDLVLDACIQRFEFTI